MPHASATGIEPRPTTAPQGWASGAGDEAGGFRLLLRPEEAAAVLGIGRTTLYDLLRTGQLPSVRIGASRRVPVRALHTFVDSLARRRVELG